MPVSSSTVAGWPEHSTQPGAEILPVLERFGATVVAGSTGMTVRGPGTLQGVDVDLHDVGELTPTVAALAVLAHEPSVLRGIAHLRGHETDRLAGLVTSLSALGGDVRQTEDGLEIRPKPLRGGLFHTYADHRMAHAAAVVGLLVDGLEIENIGTTAKTLPEFPELWSGLAG